MLFNWLSNIACIQFYLLSRFKSSFFIISINLRSQLFSCLWLWLRGIVARQNFNLNAIRLNFLLSIALRAVFKRLDDLAITYFHSRRKYRESNICFQKRWLFSQIKIIVPFQCFRFTTKDFKNLPHPTFANFY